MKIINKLVKVLYFLLFALSVQAQTDSIEILNNFTKVMSFAQQPFVTYQMDMNIKSSPDLSKTVSSHKGVYKKNGTSVYFNNGIEEILVKDSLMLRVNHDRKSIWVSKMNKEQLNNLTGGTPDINQIAALMQKRYKVSQSAENEFENKIILETENNVYEGQSVKMFVRYNNLNKTPSQIQFEFGTKEELTDELMAMIKESDAIDPTNLIVKEGGIQYIQFKQIIETNIKNISFELADVSVMPVWNEYIIIDQEKGEMTGAKQFSAYEVTRLY